MIKRYFLHTLQVATSLWGVLTLGVIASSILYAALNVAGVSEVTSLLIALTALVGLILLGLLVVPKSFLNLKEETEDSVLGAALQRQLELSLAEQQRRYDE